jgi:DNA-binding response OmpR family regulator
MGNMPLAGHSVLVVEDEPLIALDIVHCFRAAGASILIAYRLEDGLRLAEDPDISAAVLDFGFRDGDSSALCARLNERGIPFVLHSGYSDIPAEACTKGTVVPKPAVPAELVNVVTSLLQPTAGFGR